MPGFPRTTIENVSVSRMLIGINWFYGFSHTSKSRDELIVGYQTRKRLAETVTVFMKAGVDTVYGVRPEPKSLLLPAIKDAEQATGRKCVTFAVPTLDLRPGQAALDNTARILDEQAQIGATFCLPHQASTDALCDRRCRVIRDMDKYCKMIRERGMIPGLSTHMPEVPVYADENDLDVATYIQIYNAAGFLMQIEVDWVHRMIWGRRKPVIVIKPMAAGRLPPLVGMAFVWATLRPQDMVCVGTLNGGEARELIDISLSVLERRAPTVKLQRTRSKESVEDRRK
ncbi:MAG: hypothetical protein NTW87_25930 [Planctomycetota bacterium]|nr:hypothetical protein [Planctomycetota bacterium]